MGPLGIVLSVGAAIGLAMALRKKPTPPEALNNPALRPPPAPDAATRFKQQEALIDEVLSAPIPPRAFQIGEKIGVDIFAAGIELAGLPQGIVNMTVTALSSDPRVIEAVFTDSRFPVEPLFNDDGTPFGITVPKNAVAPALNPAGL